MEKDDQLLYDEMADVMMPIEDYSSFMPVDRATSLPVTPQPIPIPQPFPFPWFLMASGCYEWTSPPPQPPQPGPIPPGPLPWWFSVKRQLRLDVDGRYPQMTISGTESSLFRKVHWIASVKPIDGAANQWGGDIWYKDGDTAGFVYTKVIVKATLSLFKNQQKATLTLSGGGQPDFTLTYQYASPYFHPVEFEYDAAANTSVVTSIDTHAHPNRPANLPNETLSIETVFRRAGFNVTKSGGDNTVALTGAGADGRWSDAEMHDAMQTYWSKFANRAQWSMWVFFASLHEEGTSLGGIMFDDIGPNHRQGTAIFNDAFIATPPAGDPAPEAWVRRMRFWTACHEMGHAFNLAHSWQKALGTPWRVPLPNEPEVRSFMNYPYRVSGGQAAFFADFEYRFSEAELLFLRHAPERFVQMGNANWFDQHGFEQYERAIDADLKLELRVNRKTPIFEFLEPVVLELKLTNTSSEPKMIESKLLSSLENMVVILKHDRKPARQFVPYAQHCWQPQMRVLNPGESIYESLFVSAGRNGWDIAEPGYYSVQIALHLHGHGGHGSHDEAAVLSNTLQIRVAPPRSYDEEFVAQDFFSDAVGRVLTFDGSRTLTKGNDILREVADRFGDRRVAIHAKVALGSPLAKPYKLLNVGEDANKLVQASKPDLPETRSQFTGALFADAMVAAETLGHVDYKFYADFYSDCLAEQGDRKEAEKTQAQLQQTLSARKVKETVLQEIKHRRDRYKSHNSK